MPHYDGKFHHWDVNNEMLHVTYLRDRLGDAVRVWMFQEIAAQDPDVELHVNDYNVVSGGQSAEYVEHIQGLIDAREVAVQLPALPDVLHYVVGFVQHRREEGGHELGRIVGLEPGGVVGEE